MRHYCVICDVAGAFNGILERITTLHLSFSLSPHGDLPLLIHTKFSLFTPEIQTHLTLSADAELRLMEQTTVIS